MKTVFEVGDRVRFDSAADVFGFEPIEAQVVAVFKDDMKVEDDTGQAWFVWKHAAKPAD